MPDAMSSLLSSISDALGGQSDTPQDDYIQSMEERLQEEQAEQKSAQYNLSQAEKDKIAAYIKKLVDDCINSRTDWQAELDESIDLYEGVREPKSDPWPNCSNITTRVVATHARLMQSKLYPAVWSENLIHWRAVSADDQENVENVRKFMDWIIRQEMKMGKDIDDILHDLIIYGTVAIKVRWDTEYRRVRDKDATDGYKNIARQKAYISSLPIDEVYFPDTWGGEDEAYYLAHNAWQTMPTIKDLKNRGHLVITDKDMEKITGNMHDRLPEGIRSQKKEHEGTAEYYAHMDTMPVRIIECYIPWEINGQVIESAFGIDYNSGKYVSGKPLTAVSPTGTRPVILGQFIKRPGRALGIGLPALMMGLAAELDAIHNQRVDAGTISIAPFGFYRAASNLKPEKIQIGPGVMIPVDSIDDVKLSQFPNNAVQSFQEERIIIEYIEKLTATSAYQMGRESDIVKSRATATGTMAIIQQGEQAYTLLGVRTQRIVSRLLNKIFTLYQSFMPSGLADRVIGGDAGDLLFPDGLSIEDIAGGYDTYMTLDSTAGSIATERQINAQIVEMAPNLLTIAQDPRGYRMASDLLKSLNKHNVELYLGPPPQPQENPTAGGLGAFGQGPPPVGPGQGPIAEGTPNG